MQKLVFIQNLILYLRKIISEYSGKLYLERHRIIFLLVGFNPEVKWDIGMTI